MHHGAPQQRLAEVVESKYGHRATGENLVACCVGGVVVWEWVHDEAQTPVTGLRGSAVYANLPTSAKRTVEALGGILDKEAAAARRTKKKP